MAAFKSNAKLQLELAEVRCNAVTAVDVLPKLQSWVRVGWNRASCSSHSDLM
jgi:hypothetical protein